MASISQPVPGISTPQPITSAAPSSRAHPTSSLRFDVLMILTALWAMIGLFLDGSAHAHNAVDTFFTPWHLALYTGIFSNAVAIFWVVMRNQAKGYRLWDAIPAGYELSAVGVIICGIGGVCDLLWHTLLGIEVSFQALLSPPHLMLAFGIFLFVNGAFRSAWRRPDSLALGTFALVPMLISLGFTFLILTFFTFPVNPFYNMAVTYPTKGMDVEQSVSMGFPAILVQVMLMMGCLLLAIRRWKLPFGSITFLLAFNILALSVINSRIVFLPAMIITGLLGDVLILTLRPSISRLIALRIFAFAIPFVLYLLYFLSVALFVDGGVGWQTPFWSGSCVIAGLVGVMLSYLMVPSPSLAVPPEQVIQM